MTKGELDAASTHGRDPIAMAASLARRGDRREMARAAAACVREVRLLAPGLTALLDDTLRAIDGRLASGSLDEAAARTAAAIAEAWDQPESDVAGAILEAAGRALDLATLSREVEPTVCADALAETVAACIAAIELAEPARPDGAAAARIAGAMRAA